VILDFLALYDIHSNTFLQSKAGLRYVSCCWEVGLVYDYKNPGPGLKTENSVRVNFELRGATQDTRPPADWMGRVPSGWLQQQ
jgi:lipopolysaccharide assembly outer membrane protein LptD (OstA)